MILGRTNALWLSLVATILNVAVVLFNVPLTVVQLAALNGLALAIVGVIANNDNPTTVATFAMTTKPPGQ